MATDTLMEIAGPVTIPGRAGDQTRVEERDVLLASAIAHLLFAYDAIDEFSQESTKPWSSRAFVNACRFLCAALMAIDEFSESMWADD